MKGKKLNLILGVVIGILLLLIGSSINNILFKSEKEVRVAKKFISKLCKNDIISENGSIENIIKEDAINKTSNNNTKVKYSIILDNYAVDLSNDYKIIGFSNKDIKKNNNKEEISEGEAIFLAKQYLEEITKDDFGFKKINLIDSEDSSVYNIIFYKYIGNYPCYNQEINTIINKFTGKLEGYTNYTIDDIENIKYINDVNINNDIARENLVKYFEDMNAIISTSRTESLEYISISNSEIGLAYIFNITHINNVYQSDYQVFVRADTGEVINNNIDIVLD